MECLLGGYTTPDIAVAQAQEAVKGAEIMRVELKTDAETGSLSYEIHEEKNTCLFGFIPVSVKTETKVSAELAR